jgi:AcrR family transcriptional regulator
MVEAGPKKGLPQLSSGPQPQQRRSQERRRQLAKVALRLIEERGFEALSVNEIAEEAGISIGGMYRYIRTKTDLLVMACDDIFGGLREQMLEAVSAEQGLENKLSAAMRVYWLACHDRQDLLRLTYREYRSLPPEAKKLYKRQELEIADVFRDLIRAGIIIDEFRAADDGVVAHEIIFLSHMNAFKNWALHGVDLDRLLTEHVELFVSRLRREAAIGPDRRR